MYPAPFDYHRPETLEEATGLLDRLGGSAAVLAGGMSLIPRLKARTARPGHVLDVGRLAELTGEGREDGTLVIGALTRHAELAASAEVASAAPLLAETARQVGDPQVRNAGTLGGAAGEIYPGADLPAALLVLGARLRCRGTGGARTVSTAEQFARDDGVASGPTELVTAVEVPVAPDRTGSAHVRLERRAGLAVVGCSAQVTLDEQGRHAVARAALCGVRPAPVAALTGAELHGEAPAGELHREVAAGAVAELEPAGDLRGSAPYRRRAAAAVLARALDLAAQRAAQGATHG